MNRANHPSPNLPTAAICQLRKWCLPLVHTPTTWSSAVVALLPDGLPTAQWFITSCVPTARRAHGTPMQTSQHLSLLVKSNNAMRQQHSVRLAPFHSSGMSMANLSIPKKPLIASHLQFAQSNLMLFSLMTRGSAIDSTLTIAIQVSMCAMPLSLRVTRIS